MNYNVHSVQLPVEKENNIDVIRQLTNWLRGNKTPRMSLIEYIILAGAMAIFAVISLMSATRSSIWFDEAFSAYLIRFDFWNIAHYTSLDVHPPLYYWLLKAWSLLFGTSDLALRSMSVLFGTIVIASAFILVRRLFGQKAAYWSLPMLVFMPFLIRYAEEARMYTMVVAIALTATYALIRALEEKRRKWWVIYGVLVSLGMWTHYFAALIWLSHWAWRFGETYKPRMEFKQFRKQFFTKQWVIAHIIAIGLFLPWLPLLVYQTFVVQSMGFWIPPIDGSTLPSYVATILFYYTSSELTPWFTVLLLGMVCMCGSLMTTAYRAMDVKRQRGYRLLACMAIAPVVLLLIGSLPPLQPSFVDRYLLAASVALILLIGVAFAYAPVRHFKVWQRNLLVVTIIGSMVFGVVNMYKFGNFNKITGEQSAAKQVVAAITASSTNTEPIIANSPWLFYDTVQYTSDTHEVYFIDADTKYRYGSLEMLRTSDMFKIKDLQAFEKLHQYIWYVDMAKDKVASPPDSFWQPIRTINVVDPHTGKPSYHAVLYKTH